VTVYFDLFYEDFNFYKAELTIDGIKLQKEFTMLQINPIMFCLGILRMLLRLQTNLSKDYIVNYVNVEEVRCQEGNLMLKILILIVLL
jgi:hypothetical protein